MIKPDPFHPDENIYPARTLKIFSVLLLLIFLLFFPCSAPASEGQHSTYYYQKAGLFRLLPNSQGEIIFLGDSITDGGEWGELLGNPKIINRGISGDTTQGILERLGEVTESRPEKIFLMIGVNDLALGKSVDYVLSNLARIIRKILRNSPETELYVQSLLPVNDRFDQFKGHTDKGREILEINRKLKDFCERQGVEFIDLHGAFQDEDGRLGSKYTNDGLHLTGLGYVLWASRIRRYIEH